MPYHKVKGGGKAKGSSRVYKKKPSKRAERLHEYFKEKKRKK